MPPVPAPRQRPRRWPLAAALFVGAVFASSKWLLDSSIAFAGHARTSGDALRLQTQRECSVGCKAGMKQFLRRDPFLNQNMQKFIIQQKKVMQRQSGPDQQSLARAKLARLGLAGKIKSAAPAGIWHHGHPVPGDVFTGFYSHPTQGDMDVRVPMTITITGDGTAKWEESDEQGEVAFQSDVACQDDREKAMYLFNKFNLEWRDFNKPVPTAEELEHISLAGLRLFFLQVAQEKDFPSQEDFEKSCADPSKGMHLDEFLNWIVEQSDDEYMGRVFPDIFTGRRIRIETKDMSVKLVLDGDYQDDVPGLIAGYMEREGEGNGKFNMQLQKRQN